MLESYVTPLLMSYVNRYIKNLKPSDLQLSLWGGDVVLSKLDLKLDVLEQELRLPFTFLSGHIHELRIHVPWTKLSSEPVQVTINTMECILKLREGATLDSESVSSSSEGSRAPSRIRRGTAASPSDSDLPPGYGYSLIRRVLNNVCVCVNNLILKYVEDDIVLSVNITSAECVTVDELWDPAFMDITPPDLVLRKRISFSDCTVCLDKRDASGKIEFYQDPLIYKCSFTTRLHFTYENTHAKIPAVIKVHSLLDSLKLSLTDQQIPMFLRLVELALSLYYGEMEVYPEAGRERAERDPLSDRDSGLAESPDLPQPSSVPVLASGPGLEGGDDEEDQGWVSWAWSFIPAMVGAEGEENEQSGALLDPEEMLDSGANQSSQTVPFTQRDPVLSISFYCTRASLTFKLTESCPESSFYSPQKLKSREALSLELEGITLEALLSGECFFDCQVGVVGCRAICLKSIMGVWDFEENMNRKEEEAVFLRCGDSLNVKGLTYMTNSLFDYRSPENNGIRAEFILDAERHREVYTESAGLQRYGAFYMDYLYTMENTISACEEQSQPDCVCESSVKRMVLGPLDLQLNSSAVHRVLKMISCRTPPDKREECVFVQPEQVSTPPNCVSSRQTSVMLTKTTITVPAAEYNLLHLILPQLLGERVSSAPQGVPSLQLMRPLPALQIQCERVTLDITQPGDPQEEHTLRHNPPESTYTHCCLKIFELQAGLTVVDLDGVFQPLNPIIPSFSTALSGKLIDHRRKCLSVPVRECVLELPQMCVQATRAQVLLLECILSSWMHPVGGANRALIDILISHAHRTTGVKASTIAPVLEVCVQRLEIKVCEWPALLFISGTLGAIKVCVRTPAVVPVLQAPCDTSELKNSRWLNSIHKPSSLLTPDLLQITLQIPQQEQTLTCCPGAVLLLSLQGVAVNLDPVLSTWILFQPQRTSTSRHTQQVSMRKRREDEASVGSTAHTHTSSPLKSRTVTESRPLSLPLKVFPSSEEPPVSPEERMKNLITNTWNAVKQLTLQVELQPVCAFLPSHTLPSPSALLCDDVPGTVRSCFLSHESVCDALVVCLPQISVTSAGYRHTSPLQDAPFHPRPPLEEGGGFPWTLGLSGLSVYSLRGHTALSLLDPLGCSSSLALTAPKLQSSDAFIVCVHVDLEPAHLHCTNAQVELVFSLWCRWSQVYNAFSRMQSSHTHTHRAAFQESSAAAAGFPESSAVGGATSPMHSSTCSPSADLGSAAEGASAHSEELAGCEVMTLEQKTCSISSSRKMSVWMQWMLPKLTLTLREHEVCVMAELEELSSSVDIQDVYTKLKCKVGRFHIDHYRSGDALTSEVVLSCSEKLNRRTVLLRTLPQQEPLTHSSCFPPAAAKALEASHGFLSLTYTRAVTRNVRHRLTHRSQTPETHTLHSHPVDASPRFLHEILLNTQPFDLVLSPRLLRTLQSVFTLHTSEHILTPSVQRVHTSRRMRAQTQLCSSSLPLIYLNTSTIRIFCPLEEMHSHCTPDSQWKSRKEDTVVLKISSLCVTPQAENPLPRTVLRKDIYQRALSLGVVGEPGSEVEDRQYQLDLQGINMGTAAWHQLRAERERERGTSESRASTAQNPALEWNTASRIRHQQEKRVILSPIINDFSIRITAAPAVVYRKPSSAEEVLVCGHSLEMNVTSNLDLFLSVSQTHTLQQLLEETLNLTREETHNSKVSPAPSPPFAPPSVPMESVCGQDSGFGSDSARVRLAQVERHLTRPPPQLLPLHPKGGASSLSFVPFDIFLTAGRVSLMMFDHDTVEEEESGKKSWEAAAGHHETSSCLEAGTVQRDTSFRHCETILGEHQAESRQKDDSLGISETVTEDNVAGVRPREVTVDSNPGLGSPCPSGRQALGQTVVRAPGRRAEAHRYPLPLLFVQVNQPSAILSIHQRRQRMEISLFDLTLKGPNASYICHDTGKSLPEPQDYSVFWFQTTAGEPDARTGIPPPLLTVSIRDLLSRPELNMIISRPLRVTPTLAKIDQAKAIWEKLFSEKDNEALPRTQTAPAHNNEGPTSSSPKTTTDPSPHNSEAQMDFVPTTEVPHTFELLLSFFRSPVLFQKVTVNTVQLVLSLQMESGSAPPSLTLSLSSLTSAVKLNCANKPTECVSVSIQCGDALLRSSVGNRSAVFAGPFSFTAYIEADWCRHSGNPTPEVQGMPRVLMDVKGGLLQVFWGQLQHNCVSEMLHQLQNHWSDMAKVEVEPKDKPCSSDCVPPTSQSDQSEHSADDLRTGLFQYIQDPGRERIPVAQELVFWAESEDSPGVMLWRYTQSRIITHLRITPVPFNTCDDLEITTADLGDMLQVPCSLEYWDELQGVFVPYREFRLSESSVCELQLPSLTTHTPQSDLVTSDLWRIVLNSTGDPSDESSESEAGSDPLVCVSALAACTRVDSCFSPRFVPSFGLGLHLAHLEVHCCTHLDQLGTVPCHKLRPFLPDRKTPLEHEFAVVCVSNFSVFARQWCNRAQWSHALSFSSTLSCKLLEYRNLTLTPVVQPVALQAWGTHTLSHGHHTLQGDATLEPLHVRFGQYSIHTLERAMHAWSQNGQTDTEEVVFSHYVVCNDTQEVMRFGQVDTDESILLSSNQSHQYSWRSHRSPQLLHICLESLGNWRWAEPFSVDEVGTKLRTITNRGRTASLIIRVRELSGVQKQVLICGRQLFCSFLDISLELRIDHGCSGSETNQLINNFPAHSRLPSLVLENEELGSVSVRTSSELPWSSSVCMDQDSAVLQVACSDESVLHIWCHQISLEPNTHSQQRMVVFTPLFVIRSHLPDPVLVHVEKRSLGLTNSQIIHGRGHTHTLLGVEAEITHHLTFQPSEDEDASPCAVPVSTAVIKQIQARVDQNQNQQNLNPQELLDYFYGEKMDSTFPWPYCTREKERSGVVEPVAQWDSPMRVCLSVWRRGLNTLLVELLPWALLRNHTHSELWLFEGERILTQIPVGHTLVPPNLKEAFQIGVYWPDTNTVHKSAAVRLVHEELSPRWQEGGEAEVLLLDEEGYVHIDITLGTRPGSLKRCQFCLSSTVELGIQVLQIENRTVLLNHTTHSLRYRAATPQDPAVAPQQADTDLSIFTLPASVSDEVYLRSALPFWDVVCVAEPADAQLLFSLEETDPHWSTPALVRSDLPRQSVSVPVTPSKEWPFSTRPLVVTCQEHLGVSYMRVSDDPNPRMKIHNRCPERILLKESGREYVRLLPALSSVHHELFYQALSFPECKAKETLPALLLRIFTDTPAVTPTFKIDPDTLNTSLETPTPSSWTDPIDINSPGTQVVFLPGFGCLYVDILHESGCITLTLAAESSATELINTHRSPGSSLFFTFVLREATVCLCDDLSSQSSSIELLRLSISRLMLLLEPSQNSSFDPTVCSLAHTLTLRCAHLQLDNQLYQRASFHFPVILSPEPPSNEDFLSLRITLCPNIKPQQLTLSVCPARVYLEDTFIYYLRTLIQTYIPEPTKVGRILNRSVEHEVPSAVLEALQALVSPLALQSLCVEPLTLTVSVHASLKIYIASDHTPLSFTLFQRSGVCTTPRQLTHTLAMHYAAGALFRAGWVVGSLEILGSPASLVRSIGNGVSDFFRLPYEGLTRGPGAFISGVSRGTNSFIKHISKGTLTSITNLATSVSRNMDRLSLDEEHFTRQEEWRREHPESLGEGLRHGLSRLGLSLLGAVAGIVDQPMQSFTRPQDLPDSSSLSSSSSLARGFISGVGRGIVGAFTKPIGGAAELVSQTGYGLLHGAGLWQLPQQLHPPIETRSADASNSHLKYLWKMLGALGGAELHMAIEVSVCNSSSSSGVSQERGGCLLLSSEVLFVVSVCEDAQQQAFPITEVQCHTLTPGRITLTLQQHRASSDPEVERLSELQYNRLLEFVRDTSQYLSSLPQQSLSSSSLPQQSPASSSSGCVSKVYEYQADDAFARVFVSKFHAVKNRALRIGFN